VQLITQNLLYAWRQLRHSPEFALLAIVTLALGIGANTAMFTVVENVLLRPLPYADSDKLIYVGTDGEGSPGPVSWPDYRDIRESASTISATAAYANDVGVIQTQDASVSVVTTEVTPNLFEILGVPPLRGRAFTKEEGQPNGPTAVILSEGLWRKVFGAGTQLVNQSVRVNGQQRTVIGVMPRSFRFPESAGPDVENGLWLPAQPTADMLQDRGYHFFTILAKPAAGVALKQVQAELALIATRTRNADSKADRNLSFRAVLYREIVTGPVKQIFLALVAALGLVLLIACANVANLLIARCLGRQHEFAVRAALGSGKGRLAAQMVVEAGLVSVLGCALGLLIAYWITAAIHNLPPGTIPRADAIQVRWTVILFLGAIATLTTLLSALLPALFVSHTEPQNVLQAGSRSLGTKSIRAKLAGWLVIGEVALSVLLLIATGLLFRTLWGLEHTKLGFETKSITSFIAMPANSADNSPGSVAALVYQPLLEGLTNTPGVDSAALVTAPPLSGTDVQAAFRVVGWPRQTQRGLQARLTAVSEQYERLMSTPILRGRNIGEQDAASAPFVATINETLARKYFSGKEPLGQQLDLGGKATGMLKRYTIVGVVADQIDNSTSEPPKPLLMLPYRQIPPSSVFYPALLKTMVHFVVKTHGAMLIAPATRALFHRIAPDLALDNFQTMQEVVDQSNFGARLGLYLIGAFAALAVLMVIAGLYGVLTQVVKHRQREFGVRMALGATRPSIVRMVLLQGSVIVATGLAVGIVLALSTGRLIKSFLYGVTPLDAITYVFVSFSLLAIGIIAALLPAWRAASFEPMKALRET
jgi:putative ABC transport system permease protein